MEDLSPIRWESDQLILLDQRYLPHEKKEFVCHTLEQAAQAISELVVRGAPAIGITAAYAVYLGFLQAQRDKNYSLDAALNQLKSARPTAVNLVWAVLEQQQLMDQESKKTASLLLDNAKKIHAQDIQGNQRMGAAGAQLIGKGANILTHCNAGALATGGYGTALGVIRAAWSDHRIDQVYASETRPWSQGLRLTAWELEQAGISVKVVTEGAISSLLRLKSIDWIVVGADRVCANGDVVNKIGTANLAYLAQHFGVSLMVVAPVSTIDPETVSGNLVTIEERSQQEILGEYYADSGLVSAWNPVFDVTPASLVTALVTDHGVILYPDREKIRDLLSQKTI